MFHPNVYAQLAAIDPAAAAQYLASTSAPQAAAATSAPPAVFTPPPAAQPGIAQGFQQAQAQAAPQQAPARGTLEDFFAQQSGSAPSVTSKFFNLPGKPQGSWLQLTVLYDVTNADVQHDKTPQGVLKYFQKNGQDDLTRPKLVLVVKVEVTGSSDGTHTEVFPDGAACLWLKKGPVTDNLVRAMTAAGDPSGYPKAGATMIMQSAGELASRTVGYRATKLYDFQYAPPAQDLQAVAQAASGFPASQVSVPTAVPTPAPASAVAPAPVPTPTFQALVTGAAPAPAAATLPTLPAVAAAPSPAPSLTTPTATAAAPIPEVDDPKAAERAALLAKLQGLSS